MTARTSRIGYVLLLALGIAAGVALPGCHLGPRGQAAVAAATTIRTLDAACRALDTTTDAAVADAVRACSPQPDPVGCFDSRMAGRQRAIGACRVYGQARGSEVAQGAVRAALSAIGGVTQ